MSYLNQVKILPISEEKHGEYAKNILEKLMSLGIRAELDDRSERLSAKIRNAQLEKVPYMVIIGDKEVENKAVTLRHRDIEAQVSVSLDEFAEKIQHEITMRALKSWIA